MPRARLEEQLDRFGLVVNDRLVQRSRVGVGARGVVAIRILSGPQQIAKAIDAAKLRRKRQSEMPVGRRCRRQKPLKFVIPLESRGDRQGHFTPMPQHGFGRLKLAVG